MLNVLYMYLFFFAFILLYPYFINLPAANPFQEIEVLSKLRLGTGRMICVYAPGPLSPTSTT